MNESRSTAPDVDAVLDRAKPVRDQLERTIFALPGRGTVTAEDLTILATRLRGLAKVLDRHAPTRETESAAAEPSVQRQGAVWTYPGQQR